ncbi:hypothetical protein FRC11_002700, partial [Ceratobasidium sp. 423]
SQKSISLVSKAWRSITLPLLFEGIAIHGRPDNPPEGIIQHIIDQEAGNEDRRRCGFGHHVRRLSVNWDMDNGQLETFGRAVSTLQNLDHLRWTVSQLTASGIEWYGTLAFLLRQLPKLRSINLVMAQNDITLQAPNRTIQLRYREYHCGGGRELITMRYEDDSSKQFRDPADELPSTLVEFIRSLPNIESLSLQFEEDDERGAARWSSFDLFSALSSNRFPNLRKLSIASTRLGPNDEEFQQFIRNHGQLQKVILNTGAYDENWWDGADISLENFTPQYVEELMPSIRHFGGPGCFVGALLNSNLSKQLEVLELIEPACEESGTVSELLQEIGNSIVPELPCLKGLGISIYGDNNDDDDSGLSEWENALGALSRISGSLLALEELIIYTWEKPSSDELEELLELLGQLPRLRWLAVPSIASPDAALHEEIQHFNERVKDAFPRLQIVDRARFSSSLI